MMNKIKNKYKSHILVLTSLLFFTPLRMVIVVLMPFSLYLFKYYIKYNISKRSLILITLLIITSIVGLFYKTTNLSNVILFLWIYIPLIILMFSNIKFRINEKKFNSFYSYIQAFAISIDIIGFITRFIIFKSPDEFGVIYGRNFQYVSGLAVMNIPFLLYHLIYIINKKASTKNYIYLIFFSISFISCFFGLGLICLLLTLITYIFIRLKYRSIIYLTVGGLVVYFSLLFTDPTTIEYNVRNINYTLNGSDNGFNNARKILMYIKYFDFIKNNPSHCLLGTGGGGYNSRIAFLLNNESNNIFTEFLGHHMPKYHKTDAYPLWNKEVASLDNYTDGTRNKPFSSIVALAAEGGLIFFTFFMFYWFKVVLRYYREMKYSILSQLLFCLNIFWFLSMLTEVWFESSEFLFFLLFQSLTNAYINKFTDDTKDHTLLLAGGK